MDHNRFLRLMMIVVAGVSVLFSVLSLMDIPVQFYWWEIFIDGKIILLSGILCVLLRKQWRESFTALRSLFVFRWKQALFSFLLPSIVIVVSIGIGWTLSDVRFEPLSNATTVILATLFDIPALYFFSLTTVLLEELIFRGMIPEELRRRFSPAVTGAVGGIFWMVYAVPELFDLDGVPALHRVIIAFSFGATGMFCTALTRFTGSLWNGYSFRVGMTAVLPLLISSVLIESDSFFTTKGMVFAAEGITFTLIVTIAAVMLLRRLPSAQNGGEKEILLDYLPKSDNIKS